MPQSFDELLNHLNPKQRQAVSLTSQSCLVLAGAGCGKTSVISYKVCWLLKKISLQPQQIAAITFTNKAANEMRQRISGLIQNTKLANKLNITTFHSLGLQLLKKHHQQAGLPVSFSLLDGVDSQTIIKDIISDHKLYQANDRRQLHSLQSFISQQKNSCLSAAQSMAVAKTEEHHQLAQIYQQYEQRLQQYRCVDFDDLLMIPVVLLGCNSVVQEYWQNCFRHLLVDEYQDTNDCQYQFVKLLKNDLCHITAVGDDSQSIYTWRGANPETMLHILKDIENIKLIPLEQNYRSTNTILEAANALISQNTNQLKKTLWSNLGEGEPLRLIRARNEDDEAQRIISYIRLHRIKHDSDLGNYCILFRSNFKAEAFEKQLRQAGLNYKVSGGISLFDRAEIKTLIAYLRVMANPSDDAAFLRIVNTPKRGIGTATVAHLMDYSIRSKRSLMTCCNSLGLQGFLKDKTCQQLNHFYHWMKELTNLINQDISQGLSELLTDCEYFEWLKTQAQTPKQAENQILRVNDFCSWLKRLQSNSDNLSFNDIVQRLTLVDMLSKEDKPDSDAIKLMTIHAAKGLEFPYVFVTGLVEGNLPNHNNINTPNGVMEERRLTYVAITRSQRECILSYATQRKNHKGKLETNQVSRYINEIPDNFFAQEALQLSESEKQKQRENAIAQLNQLLSD